MNRREKLVFNEIRKNIRIRWSDLKRIIVDEKRIISERPFRELLNDLVDRGIVYKDEIEKGHTEYYVDKEWKDIEKRTQDTFKNGISEFKKALKHIQKTRKKIPDEILASYFVMLWKICNQLEFKSMLLINLSKNEQIVNAEDFDVLREQLIELISYSNFEKSLDMLSLADSYLQYETEEMKKAFRKDWESRDLPIPPK